MNLPLLFNTHPRDCPFMGLSPTSFIENPGYAEEAQKL